MTFIHDLEALLGASDSPLLSAHPSWERVPLSSVATVQNGAAFASARFGTMKGIPLIRIRDLGRTSTSCFYDGPYDPSFLVQPGDLLVGMDGEFKIARWVGPPGLLNQRVCRIIVRPEYYDGRLLELVLQGYLDTIHRSTSSQTVTHLSSRTIAAIPLPLPVLAEQHRIVAKVEALLAVGNATREHLTKVPAILKRFRQSVLSAACSGRLTEGWRGGRSLRELVPDACKKLDLNPPFDLATDVDVAQLPPSWRCVPIGNISEFQQGMQIAKATRLTEGGSNRLPILRIGNYANRFTEDVDFVEVDDETLIADADDIILTRTGETRGKVLTGYRGVFHNNTFRLNYDKQLVLRGYLIYWLQTQFVQEFINRHSGRSAQPDLTHKAFGPCPFALPPLPEQREIIRRVEALFALADTIEKLVATAWVSVERLTPSILAKAFRGELVPTEAELAGNEGRDYEPASALLERIRAGRAEEDGDRKSPLVGLPGQDGRSKRLGEITGGNVMHNLV